MRGNQFKSGVKYHKSLYRFRDIVQPVVPIYGGIAERGGQKKNGSIWVSEKLPTYSSPEPKIIAKTHRQKNTSKTMKEMGVCFLVPLSSYLSPLHAVCTIQRTGTTIVHSSTFLSEEITKMGNECHKSTNSGF